MKMKARFWRWWPGGMVMPPSIRCYVWLKRYVALSVLLALTLICPGVHAVDDMWELRAALPTGRNWYSLEEVDGTLYAVGGSLFSHGSGGSAGVDAYDPSTDSWSAVAAMPLPRHRTASGVLGSTLYIAGGANNSNVIAADLMAYDATSNSWTILAPMPDGGRSWAVGAGIDDKFYVIGGLDQQGPSLVRVDTVSIYDPATSSWTSGVPMPTPRSGAAGAVVDGVLYVMGGRTGGGTLVDTVEAYHPLTGQWLMRAPLPSPRWGASASAVNGKIYVIGGSDHDTVVDIYDPDTDSWSPGPDLVIGRGEGSAAAGFDNTVYAMGGRFGLTANEALSVPPQAAFIYTKIVDTETLIPGESTTFDAVYSPTIDNGQVVFYGRGKGDDGADLSGFYSALGGVLSRVADRQTPLPLPLPSGMLHDLRPPLELRSGTAAFSSSWYTDDKTRYGMGIFAEKGLGLEYVVGLGSNTVIPNSGGDVFTWAYYPSIDGGTVTFSGGGSTWIAKPDPYRPENNSVPNAGIYSLTDGTINIIADKLTPVPDDGLAPYPGGDGNFYGFCSPASDNGQTVFGAGSYDEDFSRRVGLYLHDGLDLHLVADTDSTPLPGEGGGFTYLNACTLDLRNGVSVFYGQGTTETGEKRLGIYKFGNGGLSTVADTTTYLPGFRGLPPYWLYDPQVDGENIVFTAYSRGEALLIMEGLFLKSGDEIFNIVNTENPGTLVPRGEIGEHFSFYPGNVDGTTATFGTYSYTRGDPAGPISSIYVAALDRDADGFADEDDNCHRVPNPDQLDVDSDGVGDACQDSDGDGVADLEDNCPFANNSDQLDTDGDGVGDACDNCGFDINRDQQDIDGDNIGDVCDLDRDNDGTPDISDNCPTLPNDQDDLDLDNIGDDCDADIDGDSIFNELDGEIVSASFVDQSALASDLFTDEEVGSFNTVPSFGSIASLGGLELTVHDAADPEKGIEVDVFGGTGNATLRICGLKPPHGRLQLSAGDSVVITCGSASIETRMNQVELLLAEDDTSVVVTVPGLSGATVRETGTDQIQVESGPLNPVPVEMTLDEVTVQLPATVIVEVEEMADGQFEINNTAESAQPITAIIGDQTIKYEPGDVPAVAVAIDIKPGSDVNSINLGSGGNTPVGILSSIYFDAASIDPLTVSLASAPVKLKGKGTAQADFQDVNGDGLLDLVVHVDTSALLLSDGAETAVLEAQTYSGAMVRGADKVRIVAE